MTIVAAAFSDFLDGWIARKFRLESRLGAIMDPLTDKLFVLIASVTLLLEKDFHPFCFCLFFLRDFILIFLLVIHKKLLKSADVGSNCYGKWITFFQFLILTATVAGLEQLQYLTLIFPPLCICYAAKIRENLHLPYKTPFSLLKKGVSD